jgi:O-antigen/teichoic acid export membrane protein
MMPTVLNPARRSVFRCRLMSPSVSADTNCAHSARAFDMTSTTTQLPEYQRVSSRTRSMVAVGVSMLGYGSGALTGPIIARSLTPDDRGYLASIITIASLTVFTLPFGLDTASAYFSNEIAFKKLVQNVWRWTLVFALPVCAVLAYLVGLFLSNTPPDVVRYTQLFLLVAPLLIPAKMGMEVWLVRRGLTARYLILVHASLISNALMVIMLAILGRLTLQTAVISFMVANLVSFGIGIFAFGVRGRPAHHPESRKIAGFALRDSAATSSTLIVGRLDQLVLTRAVEPSQLGLYAVAANGPIVSSAAAYAFSGLLFSRLTASKANRRRIARQGSRIMAVASLGINGLIAVTASWLVPLVFGQEYRGSVTPLLCLLPGQVFADMFVVRAAILRSDGRPGVVTRARIVSAVMTVVLVIPAVITANIVGAAVLTSLANFAGFVALLRFGRGHFGPKHRAASTGLRSGAARQG